MTTRFLPKILFFTLIAVIVWISFGQCNQGRLSEAFAMIDGGLRDGLNLQDSANAQLRIYMNSEAEVYRSPKSDRLMAGLQEVELKQNQYYQLLDSIRLQLLLAAQLRPEKPLAKQTFQADNEGVSQVLLTGQPNGLMCIAERSRELRTVMLTLTDNDPAFVAAMPLDFTASLDGKFAIGSYGGNLGSLPLAGVLAILSKLKVDVSCSFTAILYYCAKKIGGSETGGYDIFQPKVSARSNYVILGDRYKSDIFLSAYPYEVKIINLAVNGMTMPINEEIAHYELKPTKPGQHSYLVDIMGVKIRKNKRGFYRDTFQVKKEFSYFVAAPMVSLVRPDSLNYLYAGIDNPITITAWNGESIQDMKVSATNATLRKESDGHYTLHPNSVQIVTLTVNGKGRAFRYSVRPLPDPVLGLTGEIPQSSMSSEHLASQTALTARFPEGFGIQANCPILRFHLTRFRPREDPEEVDNTGGRFNKEVQDLVKTALPGDRFLLEDIQVDCPGDTQPRSLEALSLRIR